MPNERHRPDRWRRNDAEWDIGLPRSARAEPTRAVPGGGGGRGMGDPPGTYTTGNPRSGFLAPANLLQFWRSGRLRAGGFRPDIFVVCHCAPRNSRAGRFHATHSLVDSWSRSTSRSSNVHRCAGSSWATMSS